MPSALIAPVVVLACGNPSRGDDALGPLLLERLQAWLEAEGLADGFELIGDFQLQIEHALDLAGRRLALFIDAGHATQSPFEFRRIAAGQSTRHSTHALSPEAVLAVLPRVSDAEPPPAFLLCVCGEHFELGAALSVAAQSNAAQAFALLERLCYAPVLAGWAEAASAFVDMNHGGD
jgi:hydrogenase maturation protease